MSEYGAETLEGLHLLPAYVFSEEFQIKLMSKHFEAFDKLRNLGFFIGEFVYNYADFSTAQSKSAHTFKNAMSNLKSSTNFLLFMIRYQ